MLKATIAATARLSVGVTLALLSCKSTVDSSGCTDPTTWNVDADGDGYGSAATTASACEAPDGYVAVVPQIDCDDTNADVHPAKVETCNGIDDNCDGAIDEGLQQTTYYADADHDGYGDASKSATGCDAPAGMVTDRADCDDTDPAFHPGAPETDCADPNDYNCDGSVGFTDADGDGYGACDDCDDNNAAINAGAQEICDSANADENCNGLADDADPTVAESGKASFYVDGDTDGYRGTSFATQCDPSAAFPLSRAIDPDCDDTNAAINPGATEICNGIDDDCSGGIDDGSALTYYLDDDGDGYGVTDFPITGCEVPPGYAAQSGDCDDTPGPGAAINPGAQEICDAANVDEDCDGLSDNADTSAATAGKSTFYSDDDHDNYRGVFTSVQCDVGDGFPLSASAGVDCDDNNAAVNPSKSEICNGVDDNCTGGIDEGVKTTYYQDADGDGYGDPGSTADACMLPSGYTTNSADCDDTPGSGAAINPAAQEVCDASNTDEDCDGVAENADSSATGQTRWYADVDSDTYGAGAGAMFCDPTSAYPVANNTDCNDAAGKQGINPGATEICDSGNVDENCNATADDADPSVSASSKTTFYADADSDGYRGASSAQRCDPGGGFPLTSAAGVDCNDGSGTVHPGATESCNGIDDNCNGTTDEGVKNTYYRDADGDGYGLTGTTTTACSVPSGYAATSGDCDDKAAAIHPGATEVCDASDTDENCNGVADNNDAGATGKTRWYADIDGDSYGSGAGSMFCDGTPAFPVANNTDCNDAAGKQGINPGAQEVCDASNTDEDCDGLADDADPSVSSSGKTTYYIDADNDTYRGPGTAQRCDPGGGYTLTSAAGVDCNDNNGGVHPGAADVCGDGVDDDCNPASSDVCPPYKRVYVTSTVFEGNMGGLTAADAICQGRAAAASLNGVYKAWLSDDTGSPSTRFNKAAIPYVRMDGVTVANNWTDLTDGTLLAPINRTESNGVPPASYVGICSDTSTVWSNTNTNGTQYYSGGSCGNWTGTGGSAWSRWTQVDASWTSWCSGGACTGAWVASMYCIEQ